MGNHTEVVNLLLEFKPNVNALDKDGCTALTIACKEGYHDIAVALLNVGAYINIQVSETTTCYFKVCQTDLDFFVSLKYIFNY